MIALKLVVFLLTACGMVVATTNGTNASSNFSAVAQMFAILGGQPEDCESYVTLPVCNATIGCVWFDPAILINATNETLAAVNVTIATLQLTAVPEQPICLSRHKLNITKGESERVQNAWCYEMFPIPFIATIFFMTAFVFGFSTMSIYYNGKYFDVYTMVLDTGERVFNSNYYKTSPTISYSLLMFAASGFLFATSWMNWRDEDSCMYVYAVYIFLGVVLLPFIIIPLVLLGRKLYDLCNNIRQNNFVLDEHIKPTTAEAMTDTNNNQVRCY